MRTLQQVTLLEVFLNKNSRIIFTLCKYTFLFFKNQILKEKIWDKVLKLYLRCIVSALSVDLVKVDVEDVALNLLSVDAV